MKYNYVAVFKFENNGYTVSFPDLEGCITEGNSINEAIEMAQDALNLYLYSEEKDNNNIPVSSNIDTIITNTKLNTQDMVMLISADTEKYKKEVLSASVRRTVSIPVWLDIEARNNKLSLSKILQKALKKELSENITSVKK